MLIGLLLAAGQGRRFGAHKLLARLPDGEVMALAAARRMAAVVDQLFIALRPQDSALTALARDAGFGVLPCANAAQGMGSTLAEALAGIDTLATQAACAATGATPLHVGGAHTDAAPEPKADAQAHADSVRMALRNAPVLIGLADMPCIRLDSLQQIAVALRAGHALVRPRHAGQPGQPVGFAAQWRAALRALSGDQGARALLQQQAAAIHWLDLDDPGVLLDIDTPQALAALHAAAAPDCH